LIIGLLADRQKDVNVADKILVSYVLVSYAFVPYHHLPVKDASLTISKK